MLVLKESDLSEYLFGLFKSSDKPQNRMAGSNYAFFMGGTTFGKTVDEKTLRIFFPEKFDDEK